MIRWPVLVIVCALAQPVLAAEIAGVQFDPALKGADAPGEVQLNGVALHRLYGFQVYAIGLYLPERQKSAEAAIEAEGPKRIVMNILREITAAQLSSALSEGIDDNHKPAEIERLKPRMASLDRIMQEIGKVGRGTRIALDWVPKQGTRVLVDGKARGEPIPGDDFYRALMRIWLGSRPVSDNLKQGMLGRGP
jgi:hypothetical protein